MTARPRVLIVEDDAGVRELVRALLLSADYDAHTAHDGREAIGRIHILKPEGVILDVNMPVLDGFGVLAELRDDPPQKMPRILMLSARHDAADIVKAVALGPRTIWPSHSPTSSC